MSDLGVLDEGPGLRAQGPVGGHDQVAEERERYRLAAASSFRDLIAWQKAMTIAEVVYRLTRTWSRPDQFGLGAQLHRAAVSVPANIAEGFERRSTREYLRFLAIACGSLAECETHLLLAMRIGLQGAEREELVEQVREVGRILRGIERSLGRNLGPGP
ncbi:MAG: four helix bundle protein [Xanthomonadales bacterium]|nr:four helix bundle protein [Xanthomonadales bacterium]